MRIMSEILGKELGVYFRYLPAILVPRGTGQEIAVACATPLASADTRATRCDIKDMKTGEVIATGMSYCDTRDQFEKSKGRRLAFGKALEIWSDGPILCDMWRAYYGRSDVMEFANIGVFGRYIRREFWKAYFSQMDKKLVRATK